MQKRRPSGTSIKRAFTTIIWPRRKLIAVGLLLIFVSRLCGLVVPASTKYLVDDVITGGDTNRLWTLVAVVGAATFLQAGTGFLLTRLLSVEAQHLISQLRARVQKHVLRLPIRVFDNTKSGELVSRVMNDVEGVRNLVGTGLVQLVGGVLTSVIAFVILLNIDPVLTLLSLIPLGAFGLASMKTFRTLRPAFRQRGVLMADVNGRLTESLSGVRVIKGFNAERSEERVFEAGVDRLFQNVKKTLTVSAGITSLATFLMGVASVMIMGYGGRQIMLGAMTMGEFVSFTLFLGLLVAPLMQMANIGTQLTEAFAGLDRMSELLSQPTEDNDPERTIEMPAIDGHVRFEDVHFSYEEGKPVLNGIDFEARPGTIIALVGSSGSGKSTIAGLAATFDSPDRGRVLIDGQDLSKVKLTTYRSQLGLVLQEDFLFDGTIRENILFADPEASDAQLLEAIEMAHVKEFTDRFDDGLETVIGERGVKLSGGQKQRVAIARALLANPRILVLDEATSNLDTESESYIQKSLGLLMQNRTSFVIAHRLTTIQKADLILVIEDGRIAERGKHEELLAAQGRYFELYTFQARI
ncbi:MAG: ABC transporter ATP-binding protein [Planctomycetota bacterium]